MAEISSAEQMNRETFNPDYELRLENRDVSLARMAGAFAIEKLVAGAEKVKNTFRRMGGFAVAEAYVGKHKDTGMRVGRHSAEYFNQTATPEISYQISVEDLASVEVAPEIKLTPTEKLASLALNHANEQFTATKPQAIEIIDPTLEIENPYQQTATDLHILGPAESNDSATDRAFALADKRNIFADRA